MERKKLHIPKTDSFYREEYLNRENFVHEIPENIEIEPFSYPYVALQFTKLFKQLSLWG